MRGGIHYLVDVDQKTIIMESIIRKRHAKEYRKRNEERNAVYGKEGFLSGNIAKNSITLSKNGFAPFSDINVLNVGHHKTEGNYAHIM